MRERIHSVLRWLDTHLVGGGRTFPIHHAAGSVPEADRLGADGVAARGFLADFPPVTLFERDRFRVTVFLAAGPEAGEEGPAPKLYLLAAFLDPATGRWEPLLMLHESRFGAVMTVLADASCFLATGPRQI